MLAPRLLLFLASWLLCLNAVSQQLDILVSAHYENEPLISVLQDLDKRYNIRFGYDRQAIREIRVTGEFENITLRVLLEKILEPHSFLVREISDTVAIIPDEKPPVEILPEGNGDPPKREPLRLRGEVRSEESGELLPFAVIHIVGSLRNTLTDIDGKFSLELDSLTRDTMEINYVGCEPVRIPLWSFRKDAYKKILLKEQKTLLPAIEIVEHARMLQVVNVPSQLILNPDDIVVSAVQGEPDVLRAAQLLPGISATQETSSGLFIRGSSSDQTLITLDGFTLYHLDHFFGAFTSLNSNAVKNMRIIKGATEAQYGGRIAGIVEVTGKEGNLNRTSAQIDLGALSFGGVLESPLNTAGTSSIILTARRSYTDVVFSPTYKTLLNTTYNAAITTSLDGEEQTFGGANDPDFFFQDANVKFTFRPSPKDVLTFSGYTGKDQLFITYADTMNGDLENVVYSDESMWQNVGAGGRWGHHWNEHTNTNLQVGWSRFQTVFFSQDSIFTPQAINPYPFKNEETSLRDLTLKFAVERRFRSHLLVSGIHSSFIATTDRTGNNRPAGSEHRQDGSIPAVFVQDEWQLNRYWTIHPGFRISYYSVEEEVYPEYRLSAYRTWAEGQWTLKFAADRIHQFIQRIRSQSLYQNTPDYWKLSAPDELPVLKSDQLVAGILYKTKKWTVDLEGYAKFNQGNSTFLGVYSGYSENFQADDSLGTNGILTGKGMAIGADLLVQYTMKRHHAWLSYSLMQSESRFEELDEEVVPEVFEQRHEIKLGYELQLERWEMGLLWVFGSGKPYTPLLGVYDLSFPDGTDRSVPVYGPINGARLPVYHRLDLSATYSFSLGESSRARIQLSCFNAYNRKNLRDIQYLALRNGTEPDDYFIAERKVYMLGFLPSVNFKISF